MIIMILPTGLYVKYCILPEKDRTRSKVSFGGLISYYGERTSHESNKRPEALG